MTKYFGSYVGQGLILLSGLGLLLSGQPSAAQITLADPSAPAARALSAWFNQHIPAKFQAHAKVEVQALSDDAMDNYLRTDTDDQIDSKSGSSQNASSDGQDTSGDDSDDIDGVFSDDPPQIFLRVPDPAHPDFATFAHEYGHYVWFDLMTKDDHKRYQAIYDRQKAAHHLVSEYAADSLEEGFAEAFSVDVTDPAALHRQDPLSYQFLSHWSKP